ncbi:hypothetical protein BOTBODRAFT_175312 [Botryobasidium botryosum FD-172 SS1]|uniref:Uncharacterized protein n=1 Tax=Botryobasidium botryosum (strain FD-172 SS1) TaxID=930990 RepID=A0A067MQQ1_BOTB1|nr:hypothetical protein BOTBODRAFT_175312 [Botryobasidium botryosum FD-172 SS1]
MLVRKDLPHDFRKAVYDAAFAHVNTLKSLLANCESMQNTVIRADAKGHMTWLNTTVPASEGPCERTVIVVGQLDEGIRLGSLGNKYCDSSPINDKTRVKFSLALHLPTNATPNLHSIIQDTICTLGEQSAAGEAICPPVAYGKWLELREFVKAPGIPGITPLSIDNAIIHMSSDDIYMIPPGSEAVAPPAATTIQRSDHRGPVEPTLPAPAPVPVPAESSEDPAE